MKHYLSFALSLLIGTLTFHSVSLATETESQTVATPPAPAAASNTSAPTTTAQPAIANPASASAQPAGVNPNSASMQSAATAPTPAAPTPTFTADQQTAIEKIVHEYLVKNPQVLVEASETLQKQQMDNAINKAKNQLMPLANSLFFNTMSPTLGNTKGTVTVVEFFDYRCPHCKNLASAFQSLLKSYPDLRIVYKELPIFGGASMVAAKTALAANKLNKYASVHEALLNFKGELTEKEIHAIAKHSGIAAAKLTKLLNDATLEQEIKNNFTLANQLGVQGTPFIIVVKTPDLASKTNTLNATVFPGETDLTHLQKPLIRQKLK